MTKWKPAKRVPMLGNTRLVHLGQAQAAVVPILIRWGLPFVAWAGGAYLASLIVSKAVPDVPINKKNLGLASALVGGGLTSYFLSPTIADDWKPVAYAGAVAGIAAGLYFLFQEPAAPAPPASTPDYASEEVPIDCKVPWDPQPGRLMSPALSGIRVEFDPAQSEVGGLWRNKYSDQDFAFVLRNIGRETRCFYVGLNILDSDGKPISAADNTSFPSGKSPAAPSSYGRKEVRLVPGQTLSMTLKAPSFGSAWMPITSFDTTVAVELYKNLRDQYPFQVSEPITIKNTIIFP